MIEFAGFLFWLSLVVGCICFIFIISFFIIGIITRKFNKKLFGQLGIVIIISVLTVFVSLYIILSELMIGI
ncbi:hypothetical protein RJG79_08450 [Mycoplasmatota bacterium WC44]